MSAKPFLDTNILVYAFASGDPRSDLAEALLAAGGTVSVQVLNEFATVMRRKQRRDWAEIADMLGVLRALLDPPLPLTVADHETALALARDHGFSLYDGLIAASAGRAGCAVLYSEDMDHGRRIGDLTIRNPFLE